MQYLSTGTPKGPCEADNLMELDVGPLQIVYYQQYGLEIIDYVCEGVLSDAITGAVRSADAFVRQSQGAKTGFSLNIDRPRLLLPRFLTSSDHALLALEEASLSTSFNVLSVDVPSSPARVEEIVQRGFSIDLKALDLILVSPHTDNLPDRRAHV